MTTHALAEFKQMLDNRSLISRFSANRSDRQMRWTAQRSFALQIIQGSEALRKCSPESIHNCMLDVAFTGLTLAPSQALLYLIAYGDKATLAIGYRGMEQLAYRTGVIDSIQAALVCENDPAFITGTDKSGRYILHEEARKDRGEVTHAYCVAQFSTGKQHVEVMDRYQLDAVEEHACKKQRSGKHGGAVWRGPFKDEMRKKAVIRRAWKHWPQDSDGRLAHAMQVMDTIEPVTFEGEAVRVLSKTQVGSLTDLCAEHDISTDTVCRAFGVATLSLIPEKSYEEAARLVAPV
ncbi:MAG: recombinase RecT [Gammaproteobacteria bacterium]